MRGDSDKKFYISLWRIEGMLGTYEKIYSMSYPLESEYIVWNISKDAVKNGYSVRVSLIDKYIKIHEFDNRRVK